MHFRFEIPLLAGASLLLPNLSHADLLITEIMYNPAGSDAQMEWVEIYNTGAEPIDVTGWKLNDEDTNAPDWGLLSGTLEPGEVGVITEIDEATFKAAWSTAAGAKIFTVVGWGSLANSPASDNEILHIIDATATAVDYANYDDEAGWPASDASGSIFLLPGNFTQAANDIGTNWALSQVGVMGAVNPAGVAFGSGTINTGMVGSPGFVLVPEPSMMTLLLGLLVGLQTARRRR